ncbi:related to BPL1-biotin holocarboxylase synthetase [Sporisorium reilianum f. sp. reilianum]|uniref:Related to BPL1-biotin holocarboxylase synthetase n=1 Tax=Sporisorium reilianum f. sp. reilianum TaxID=72559 RepID=A0A2N8UGJ8_9BASI|nr:related to BPL1-biotin holocarboxylase synthetase [Sporisorium reilianum f. sp. reilianum]
MSDVLVYNGPGVSTSALHHTLKTLRTLLTTYDVKTVDAKTLALDPWQKGTALVVLPGGRDLPYVSELARPYTRVTGNASSSSGTERTASREIRSFVESGGNFLGICAGAYYSSSHCTFEKGTHMEVDGARPFLRFFPGVCQGTVYPGFVYESDKGARIVDIERVQEGKRDQWRCHYNGGGAFMDADRYAGKGVEVLARYAQVQPDELRLDIDLNGTAATERRPDYAGQAAVVLSSVGLGKALLFGTHPEFPLLPTSTPVLLAENSQVAGQEQSDREERERQLRVHEQRRLQWLHELFTQRLGLRSEVPLWAVAAATPAQGASGGNSGKAGGTAIETDEPKLQPIFFASIGAGSDEVTYDIVQKLAREATSSSATAHIQGYDACVALQGATVASLKDSNDAMHFSVADADTIREAQTLCSSADYDAFSKPIVSAPAADGSAAEDTNQDKEVDLDWVPKYILVCDQTRPSSEVLPYWNIAEYEKHLVHFRQVNLQREQNKEPGHWSTWRAPFDPFNRFGSTTSNAPRHEFGTPMLYTQMVTSTQTMLDKNFRLLSALPVGTTFFATQQMSGRARGGNRWISPKGCLQFSAVFRVPVSMASKTVFLQYLSGLAVVEGIRIALGNSDAAKSVADKVRIKWPNDIYAEIPPLDPHGASARAKTATFELAGKRYAKLGGILVNSQFSGGNEFVLISGCGVNCLNSRPTTSVSDLIAIHNASAHPSAALPPITQEKLAGAILATFDSIWNVFLHNGGDFAPFVATYRRVWLHSDQQTTLTSDAIRSGGAEGEGEESVRIVGISSDYGLLQAVPRTSSVYAGEAKAWGDTEASQAAGIIQLQPDGNSFDMLQNLVKRKM